MLKIGLPKTIMSFNLKICRQHSYAARGAVLAARMLKFI